MIYVDLRNNLLRTSPTTPDEVRQFLIECATDDIGKYVAKHLHDYIDPLDERNHFYDVNISTWVKWLEGKLKLQAFRQDVWNKKKEAYDKFLTYTKFSHQDTNCPIPDKTVQVQGSDLDVGQLVLYEGNIYCCDCEGEMVKLKDGTRLTIKVSKTYDKIDACHGYTEELSVSMVYGNLENEADNDM